MLEGPVNFWHLSCLEVTDAAADGPLENWSSILNCDLIGRFASANVLAFANTLPLSTPCRCQRLAFANALTLPTPCLCQRFANALPLPIEQSSWPVTPWYNEKQSIQSKVRIWNGFYDQKLCEDIHALLLRQNILFPIYKLFRGTNHALEPILYKISALCFYEKWKYGDLLCVAVETRIAYEAVAIDFESNLFLWLHLNPRNLGFTIVLLIILLRLKCSAYKRLQSWQSQ